LLPTNLVLTGLADTSTESICYRHLLQTSGAV
jgi:hypothetical protein